MRSFRRSRSDFESFEDGLLDASVGVVGRTELVSRSRTSEEPVIKIHHAQGSRSMRIVWLCEELGLDYEIESYRFGGDAMRSDAFRRLHPLRRLPVVEIDGRAMFESLAIMQFLLERYGEGRLEPAADALAERMAYLQWLHFAEATAMVPLGEFMRAAVFTPESDRIPALIEGASARVAEVRGALDAALAEHAFIAGEAFTAADISLGYFCFLAKMVGQFTTESGEAKLGGYFERLSARPAFQRASSR